MSLTQPIRPRSTHPPAGPLHCGRMGTRVNATRRETSSQMPGEREERASLGGVFILKCQKTLVFYCYVTRIVS